MSNRMGKGLVGSEFPSELCPKEVLSSASNVSNPREPAPDTA